MLRSTLQITLCATACLGVMAMPLAIIADLLYGGKAAMAVVALGGIACAISVVAMEHTTLTA